MAKDYYEILGVSRESTPDQIKIAYHKLAKTWHPDRNHAPDAKKKFQDISEAYQVLTDDRRRREYDLAWGSGGRFDFNIQSDFFKSSDELYREFFGGKTLDESLADFLNDPMFADLKYADSQRNKTSPKQKASDTLNSAQNKVPKSSNSKQSRTNSKEDSFEHVDQEACQNDTKDTIHDKQHPEHNAKQSSSSPPGESWVNSLRPSNIWAKIVPGQSNQAKKEDTTATAASGPQRMDIDQDQKTAVSSKRTETKITTTDVLTHISTLENIEEINKIFKAIAQRQKEVQEERALHS